ncbi:MAG: hypothetical protein ACK5BQ_00215, partial [Ignavibacteria bacterium]
TTISTTAAGSDIAITANDVLDLDGTSIDADASAGVDIAAGTTYAQSSGTTMSLTAGSTLTATGATAATVNATAGALTLNANSGTGSVVVNATNAAGDVDINAGDAITVDGKTIAMTTVGGDVTIAVPGAASGNDLVLTGIDTDAVPTQMLTLNAGNAVRKTTLSSTADQGILFDVAAGKYRLGGEAVDVNSITTGRFVTVGAAGTLKFNTAAGANDMLVLNNNGNVGISTSGAGTTTIGGAAAGAIGAQSASTIGLTAGTTASIASATTNINTGSGNVNVGSATGTNTVLGTTNINATGTNNTTIGNTGAGATTVTLNAGSTGAVDVNGTTTINT